MSEQAYSEWRRAVLRGDVTEEEFRRAQMAASAPIVAAEADEPTRVRWREFL